MSRVPRIQLTSRNASRPSCAGLSVALTQAADAGRLISVAATSRSTVDPCPEDCDATLKSSPAQLDRADAYAAARTLKEAAEMATREAV
jgi:hypothetical protein